MNRGFAPILIILGIAIVVVIGGGAYYLINNSVLLNQNKLSKVITPISFETNSSSESGFEASNSANWKIYQNINPNYNYSLKYPGNIFIYPNEDSLIGQSWTNIKGTFSPLTGNDPARLLLAVRISKPENIESSLLQYYKDTIGSQIKIKFNERITKISDIETNGIKGAIYLEVIANDQLKPSCLLAIWFRNEKYYQLRLCAATEEKLQNQRQLFDQILSTFEFTN